MTPRLRRYARRMAGVGAAISGTATIVGIVVFFAAPALIPVAFLFATGGLVTEVIALRSLVYLP